MAASAVMPNTPLVALVAPRIVTWSRRSNVSPSMLLMPLSFASVLGGVITVIGTSTNLVVSDLLVAAGGEPLGIFEITPIGLPVAVVGLGVLVVASPRLLRRAGQRPTEQGGSSARYTVAMRVEADGPLVGQTIGDAGLRHLGGVFLASVERGGHVVMARPETRLNAGDTCYFVGDRDNVFDLFEIAGLVSAEQPHLDGVADQRDVTLYEAVVAEGSDLHGATLRDVGFRSRYDAAVVGVRQHGDEVRGKLGTVQLSAGDVLLVIAPATFAQQSQALGDFSVVASAVSDTPPMRKRGWVVVVALVAMVTLAATGVLGLMEASLLAAAAVLALGVVSFAEARRAVNLNVLIAMAMAISLGTAVSSSGLADEMSSLLVGAAEPLGAVGIVLAVLVATMVLTEVLSNTGAAAVMLPTALAVAATSGIDPRLAAIAVLVGASCSFLSPIGYQTNLMVQSLGSYRFSDFARLGAPVSASVIVTMAVVAAVAV